jgi:hypothetical protein
VGVGGWAGLVYYVITANSMVAFVACCLVFYMIPEHKTAGYEAGSLVVHKNQEADIGATPDELLPLASCEAFTKEEDHSRLRSVDIQHSY